MKRNVIFLTSTFLLLILIAGFGVVNSVEAQRPLPTFSLDEMKSTLQIYMGTLTALAAPPQVVRSTPLPRSTSVLSLTELYVTRQAYMGTLTTVAENRQGTRATPTPRATDFESFVQTIEAPMTLPASNFLIPSSGGQSDTTSGRPSDRYVIFRPGESIDIDGIVAFTITLAVGWLIILLVLSVAGSIFSRMMMKSILQSAIKGESNLRPIERIVRFLYGVLIALLSIYFFLSLPVLIIIIAALVLNLNRTVSLSVPGIIILGISAYGSFYMLRSIWAGLERLLYNQSVNLHSMLSRNEAPAFWQLIHEVAARLNTRPIETVYLVPDSTIAVYEKGGLFNQLSNSSERFMILGVGAISGLTQHQLKAFLAHEYSHFMYRDTGIGLGISARVTEAIAGMYTALKEKSYNHIFNPIWLFVVLFARVYFPVTTSARRYGEVFADRQAAQLYGSATFVNALLGHVHQTVLMDVKVRDEMQKAADEKRTLQNIYQLPEPDDAKKSQIADVFKQKLNQPASALAMHPSIQLRLAFISQMPYTGFEVDLLSKPAWDLFDNAEKIQNQMTQVVQKNINLHQFYMGNNVAKPKAEVQT